MIRCIAYAIVGVGLGYGYGYLVQVVEVILRAIVRIVMLEV